MKRELKAKEIVKAYQDWRKENGNRKPNRVIVKMHWDDEPQNSLVDTIAIIKNELIGWEEDALILYYMSSLRELCKLVRPFNGSDFTIEEVCEFYKV